MNHYADYTLDVFSRNGRRERDVVRAICDEDEIRVGAAIVAHLDSPDVLFVRVRIDRRTTGETA